MISEPMKYINSRLFLPWLRKYLVQGGINHNFPDLLLLTPQEKRYKKKSHKPRIDYFHFSYPFFLFGLIGL